ncbi:helix-turn-helix domain-containing protein [Microbacterium sp. 22303]|uniref:helix-turn-helix domain-containing protein n=1 Tax=Microbacterium sp. 22303 TaxID=3453905 RepID=UPI003F865D41
MALTAMPLLAHERVDHARDLFAHRGSEDLSGIRPIVARSWYRCRAAGVDPEVERPVLESARVDEFTMQAAEQHLRKLDEFAADLGGYVNLTGPNGALVHPAFLRDDDGFPDGYSLREEYSGSNGEGLALEEGRSVWLAPEEHYRKDMQRNWCFAALIRDPFHNRVRGVIGLTLPADRVGHVEPSSTLLMLNGVASRIERDIEERTSSRERSLLHEYLTISRRRSNSAVIAMDGKNLFMNSYAAAAMDGADFTVISSYVKEVMASGGRMHRKIVLQSLGTATLEVSAVTAPASAVGAVAVFRSLEKNEAVLADTRRESRTETMSDTLDEGPLRAIHGVSAEFRATRDLAAAAIAQLRSATIIGERGSGRRRIADAIAAAHGRASVYDAADRSNGAARLVDFLADLDDTAAPVIIEHADELAMLDATQARDHLLMNPGLCVILTVSRPTDATQMIGEATDSLEIPTTPLRSRREDIPVLARTIVAEMSERVLSRNLVTVLTNADWPRNVDQLRAALAEAVLRGTGREITVDDLPRGFQRIETGARLSRLEDAELSEMRIALREANGNRRLAAEMLEIGRSTLYRRMDYFRARGFDL